MPESFPYPYIYIAWPFRGNAIRTGVNNIYMQEVPPSEANNAIRTRIDNIYAGFNG